VNPYFPRTIRLSHRISKNITRSTLRNSNLGHNYSHTATILVIGEWSKTLARKTRRTRAFITWSMFSVWRSLLALLGCASYWKENHLIALFFLASFPALALIYELPTRGWGAGQTAAFSISCFVLAWIIFQIVGPNLPVETDSEIYLVPGNKPTPDAPCDHNSRRIQPKGAIEFPV
jgi:hypothetical protein